MRHGGKILIDQLKIAGATTIFTVPGESFLAALDGLYDVPTLRTIICRQEGGASMMAEAHGKLTGTPGIAFVTRGPGAANAMSGLHVAQQDSTPMILFVGLPSIGHEDREAFQEIDVKGLFGTFVKWAAVVRETSRIPEYVSRAYHVALSGRPGPVVLGLPEDMLSAHASVQDMPPLSVPVSSVSPAVIDQVAKHLKGAKRPLMLVGGPGWSATTAERITTFAMRNELPIACSFRAQDYIDNRHLNYVGHVGINPHADLAQAVRDADVLLVLGERLGEMTTGGYSLIAPLSPRQTLIHIHPDPDELNTVYRAALAIPATSAAFAAALPDAVRMTGPGLLERTQSLRGAYEASLKPKATPGAVKLEEIIATVDELMPNDSVITNGAGNYAAFLHKYLRYRVYRQQLAPTSGSMGYGLPAAIAAKLAAPHRPVIAFAGDGCLMMTVQELATAAQYGLAVIVIVANNGTYGTIRMHQEREYPGRVMGTTLMNPDFAALARAFGGAGETIRRTDEFREVFERALDAKTFTVIELKLDVEALTPGKTLSEISAGI